MSAGLTEGHAMTENERSVGQFLQGVATEERHISTSKGDFLLITKFSDVDRIGCVLDTLEIVPECACRLFLEPGRVARALAYMEGGMAVVEVERPGKRAILRSAFPRTEGHFIGFMEIVVDPTKGFSLTHYVYDESTGERRRQPVAMTKESVLRISEDLTRLIVTT